MGSSMRDQLGTWGVMLVIRHTVVNQSRARIERGDTVSARSEALPRTSSFPRTYHDSGVNPRRKSYGAPLGLGTAVRLRLLQLRMPVCTPTQHYYHRDYGSARRDV